MAGTVEGQVLNQRDGQPIVDANLQLMPEGGEQRSKKDGTFSFSGLAAADNYELVATKSGFENGIYGPLAVMDDMPLKLALALQPKNV